MHLHLPLVLLAVPALSAAFREHFLACCDSGGEVRPTWEVGNSLTIVPLPKPARTGLVAEAGEEDLVAAGESESSYARAR